MQRLVSVRGIRQGAADDINVLRDRAFKDYRAVAPGAGKVTADQIDIDFILDERARELMGEHDRWFDLKRTQTLLTRVPAYNPFVVKYDNLNKNHLVRPIPQDERNKVDGLSQNEGY